MAKAGTRKSAKKTAGRSAKGGAATKQTALAAKAVASAIAKAKKAGGRKAKDDDMDIHVHVGDVVMMGFDEAVDAEEWGARETTHEAGGKAGRGGRAAREADPQDEKNRHVRKKIVLRKGALKLEATDHSSPARRKAAAAKKAKKVAKKPAAKRPKKR